MASVAVTSKTNDHRLGSPVVRDNGSVLPGDWADVPRSGLSFPRLGLACGASTRFEDIDARWKVGRDVRRPNDVLRRARLGMASPSGSGRRMSRQELAEAVNVYLFATTRRVSNLDGNYVGRLERGEYRWPCKAYRQAFRAVLGASTDAELGFSTSFGERATTTSLRSTIMRPRAATSWPVTCRSEWGLLSRDVT